MFVGALIGMIIALTFVGILNLFEVEVASGVVGAVAGAVAGVVSAAVVGRMRSV